MMMTASADPLFKTRELSLELSKTRRWTRSSKNDLHLQKFFGRRNTIRNLVEWLVVRLLSTLYATVVVAKVTTRETAPNWLRQDVPSPT